MGAISKSEPIFTKLNTHHSRPNSLRYAKFRPNRKIHRDFGAPFTLNQTIIYMGAISQSEPIFPKLTTHHSRLNSVRYAKFRANRRIHRDLVHYLLKIGRKYIWELYGNLNRFDMLQHRTMSKIQLTLTQMKIHKSYIYI